MADSFERKVFTALAARVATLSWVKTVEFEHVKLGIEEWTDDKLPVVQFWFNDEQFQHHKYLLDVNLGITIEIVLKPLAGAPLSQVDLLDRMRDIRELMGANPRLGIPGDGMLHVMLQSAVRDYTTQPPHLIGQVNIRVLGNQRYAVN